MCQLGDTEQASVQMAAPNSEMNIRLRRPRLSETAAAPKIAKARKPVESESDSELAAGVTLDEVKARTQADYKVQVP